MSRLRIAGIALACFIALGAAHPAFAGLKINLVYIDDPPQPKPALVVGGGQLREIMQVAAENWERVFKSGNGNWKLTIEFGWTALRDRSFFAQELLIEEAGNASRITHSCILFNNDPDLPGGTIGYFADPTPGTMSNTSATPPIPSTWETDGSIPEESLASQRAMPSIASICCSLRCTRSGMPWDSTRTTAVSKASGLARDCWR